MKPNQDNQNYQSYTPRPESVHTLSRNGSPPLDSAKGFFLVCFLNVLECIFGFSSHLSNCNNLRYKSPYNIFYVKFGAICLILTIVFSHAPRGFSDTSVVGKSSWYSAEACKFNPHPACPTASGKSLYQLEKNNERFAASYDFPLGTRVKVTNLGNDKFTIVQILDRGPNKRLNRKIDLCKAAFAEIADVKRGLINVSLEVVK